MRFKESSSKRKVYGSTVLPQETRKISNKQPNLTSKEIRIRTNEAHSQQKEGNNKEKMGKNKI